MLIEPTIAGTKLFVPTSLHILMPRKRLYNMLNQGLNYPLTLLSAPAGYGKTSVLSEWLRANHKHRSTAWVSLDTVDNDFHRFWLCVFLALHRYAPDLMQPLLLLWQEQPSSQIQHVPSLLINRLLDEPKARYILVLDDYHLITEPAIHQALSYLIEHVPPQLRLILSTRVDPPLPLHRWRARGHLLEVRVDHLQCTPAETDTFLHEIMGLSLTSEEVGEITERIEGWMVGLQLFGLSLKDQAHIPELIKHASGNQRYILDYLTEEVLRQQSEHLQQFLLVTSLLDQFCAPLCDALWEEGKSQQMLSLLERKHLFVVALDGEGVWYRYHHLFADALRHRLQQSLAQEKIDALYGKASVWYAEQELRYEAMHYAVLAHDWERVITLLEHYNNYLRWQPGEVHTMQCWVEQLPTALLDEHPRLGLFAAWLWFCIGDFRRSETWLDRAEIALAHMSENHERRQLQAELQSRRATNKGLYGQADASMEFYKEASQLLDEENFYVYALLQRALALVWLARGELSLTLAAMQEAASAYARAGAMTSAYCASCQASSYLLLQGQLRQAEHMLDLLMVEPQKPGNHSSFLRGVLYSHQAVVLYEQNQLEQAFDLAQQALLLIGQAGAIIFIDQPYIVLLQFFLARQQFAAAEEILHHLLALPAYRENAYGKAWVLSDLQVRFWLVSGKLELAMQWRKRFQQQKPHPSIWAQEHEIIAQVRVLLVERENEAAYHLLATWLPQARAAERWLDVLDMYLLEALTLQQMLQMPQALQALEKALTLGEPEGYMRPFLDAGTDLIRLLQRSQEQHPGPYVEHILEAFTKETRGPLNVPDATFTGQKQALIDPLSTREQEVLELLVQGASNQEIAQALVIAHNTVKRHVQSILAKLGVRNRTQAAVHFQKLGLLVKKETNSKERGRDSPN